MENRSLQMLSMSLNNIAETLTLPTEQLELMYKINDNNVLNNATMMAGVMLNVLPIFIVFCFLHRQFSQGIERSALTGE